jgi:hypothetical protein
VAAPLSDLEVVEVMLIKIIFPIGDFRVADEDVLVAGTQQLAYVVVMVAGLPVQWARPLDGLIGMRHQMISRAPESRMAGEAVQIFGGADS